MPNPTLNKRIPESAPTAGTSSGPRGQWPSGGQFLAQMAIVLAIVVVWAALFTAYMAVAGNVLTATATLAQNGPGRARNALSEATNGPAVGAPAVSVQAGGVSVPTTNAQAGGAAAPTSQAPAGGGAAVSFSRDVEPIFQLRCVRCHAGALSTYDQVIQNVIPGDSANTLVIQVMQNGSMPRGGARMTAAQIDAIAKWIDAGAPNN
jgi:hypothetical protein